MNKTISYRIESIDLLRGLVMVLMALDHVRDYFNYGSFFSEPTNLSTTTPILFFTRWITHYCAPVFVFLAGISAFLQTAKNENIQSVSKFLLLRGLWLIFLEITVVNFGWTFDVSYSIFILQVIMAIGVSMVCLSALIFLPRIALLATGLFLVGCHNLLDAIQLQGNDFSSFIWYLLHQQSKVMINPARAIFIMYPVIPWIGLMVLGYVCGTLYRPGFEAGKRKQFLFASGAAIIIGFIGLRYLNLYGDPRPWTAQKDALFTILSFINTTKYPPSLLYLMMTIGPALLLLGIFESLRNKLTNFLVVIGRVPLFFYILHIYFIHALAIIGVVMYGRPWKDMILHLENFTSGSLATYGYPLYVVYIIWLVVVLLLYPCCKWYCAYKESNKDKWWPGFL